MRFIAAPILILLVFTQTFSQWFVLGAFRIKQAWIAKNTCENRYRPQLHCNGNCVLMRKLKQQEKEEQTPSGTLKMEVSSVVISSRSFFASLPPVNFDLTMSVPPVFDDCRTTDRHFAVFHPPQHC